MTSLAFIFGVLPLVVATGAGAEMRQSLGTAVFSGMIGVTLFGIFLTPVFFFALMWWGERKKNRGTPVPQSAAALPGTADGTLRHQTADRVQAGAGLPGEPGSPSADRADHGNVAQRGRDESLS
jgi:hypothetical protein